MLEPPPVARQWQYSRAGFERGRLKHAATARARSFALMALRAYRLRPGAELDCKINTIDEAAAVVDSAGGKDHPLLSKFCLEASALR